MRISGRSIMVFVGIVKEILDVSVDGRHFSVFVEALFFSQSLSKWVLVTLLRYLKKLCVCGVSINYKYPISKV